MRPAAILSLFVLVTSLPGQRQQREEGRPAFQFIRQDEDWSSFRAGTDSGPFGAVKHIDLDDDGWAWLSFGGRSDARFESWDGFGFGSGKASQDTFTVSRLLLHADLHLGDDLRLWVEGKTAQATDRSLPGGRRTGDLDTLALHQAFADWRLFGGDEESLTVRVGRQWFAFGALRLIGPRPWANVLRTFDGVSAKYRSGDWDVTGFWTQFVPVRKTRFNRSDRDRELYGVYATRKPARGERGWDFYLIGNTRRITAANAINGTFGGERRHTVGFRTWGPLAALGERFDGEIESAYQFGDVGSNSVDAWMASGVLGFRPESGDWQPRVFVGVDAASGDSRVGGAVGTFHQLFPLAHRYFGWADMQARQNVLAVQVGVSARLARRTNAVVTAHAFRLLDDGDVFYGTNGRAQAMQPSTRDVAQEVDVKITHAVDDATSLYSGYSHLFGGPGLATDISFFYVGFSWMF